VRLRSSFARWFLHSPNSAARSPTARCARFECQQRIPVRLDHLVRTAYTPEFDGVRFHEVLAKSALNKVPTASDMRFGWTINQMRGCLHQRTYCFARPTHEFLDLDVGKDFDT
jgi:hypothetical protein